MCILLVDDDRDLLDILDGALRRAGYSVSQAVDAASTYRQIRENPPDLVVLDVNLSGTSGFDILKELRRTSDLPVVLLTARTSEDDKVLGLDLGADDYLTKPFGYRELLARIRSRLRTRGLTTPEPAPAAEVLEVGPLVLDARRHEVRKDGRPLDITVTEFRLLRYLMLNADAVVPTRTLLQQIWGETDPGAADVLRVTLHRLRRKIEDDPANPKLLLTVTGVGIRLSADPSAEEA